MSHVIKSSPVTSNWPPFKSQVAETAEPAHGAGGGGVAQVSPRPRGRRQRLLQQLRSQVAAPRDLAAAAGGPARPQPRRHPHSPGQRSLGRSQVHTITIND